MTPREEGKRSRLPHKRFDGTPVTASSIFLSAVTGIAGMGLMLGLAR